MYANSYDNLEFFRSATRIFPPDSLFLSLLLLWLAFIHFRSVIFLVFFRNNAQILWIFHCQIKMSTAAITLSFKPTIVSFIPFQFSWAPHPTEECQPLTHLHSERLFCDIVWIWTASSNGQIAFSLKIISVRAFCILHQQFIETWISWLSLN